MALYTDPEFKAACKEALKNVNPDMCVIDFASNFATKPADELDIPRVYQSPVPLDFFDKFWVLPTSQKRLTYCCGLMCIWPTIVDEAMTFLKHKILKPELMEVMSGYPKRVSICTTFWGFERPQHLPPNFILTGPTLRENTSDFVKRLEEKDPDLYKWLEDAQS